MSTLRFEEIKMLEDESVNEFYAKFNNIVNSKFNLKKKKNKLLNYKEDSKILARKILAKGNNHKKKQGSRQYTC